MNRMENLINKIERRLGTKMLNLPDNIAKSTWPEIIECETLETFSRYFPNVVVVRLTKDTPQKDGYYVIDEGVAPSTEIIGVGDIDWGQMSRDGVLSGYQSGFIDKSMIGNYGVDDVALFQSYSDIASIFQVQIVPEFKPPNMVRIVDSTGSNITYGLKNVPVRLLIKHSANLMTISQTMMETFENLAMADVAAYLYENLKYYDGLSTVYANIDLKLNDLSDKAGKREDIINELKESYVSFSNPWQPQIWTV